jgi:predicted small secreted protein
MRKTFIALAIGMFLVTLVGCNAVEGLGEDITDTSKATREAIAD